MSLVIFGQHDHQTVAQLEQCITAEENARGVLCADGHVGYSQPIGGVVGYKRHISVSGVGYDIACGNMAVETNLYAGDLTRADYSRVADEINRRISFGIGRHNNEPVDDSVFDMIATAQCKEQRGWLTLAQTQLGTVGAGNHYVDVLEDGATGKLFVAVHFGSRGFGHKTATFFMNLAAGQSQQVHNGEMMSPPLLLDVSLPAGQDYIAAMQLAGHYAYAGRRQVVKKVLDILGARVDGLSVHNHHNFAWLEYHDDALWVVRKGATPAFPGQLGFVGGSMGDISVILSGRDSQQAKGALYSTVHGAGRVMSRNQAIKGKHEWFCTEHHCSSVYPQPQVKPPKNMKCPIHDTLLAKRQLTPPIDFGSVQESVNSLGVELRGAGADEAPQVYRPLKDVLDAHAQTIRVLHTLHPKIVVMAGKDVRDPYKD